MRPICRSENPLCFKACREGMLCVFLLFKSTSFFICCKNHGSILVKLNISSTDCPSKNAWRTFKSLKAVAYRKVDMSNDRALCKSGSPSAGGFGSSPSKPTSRERKAFCRDSRNVLPIDITSPTLCICTPK